MRWFCMVCSASQTPAKPGPTGRYNIVACNTPVTIQALDTERGTNNTDQSDRHAMLE